MIVHVHVLSIKFWKYSKKNSRFLKNSATIESVRPCESGADKFSSRQYPVVELIRTKFA